MASKNHVSFIGRLVAKPELRYTQTGKAVVNFDIAVDRKKYGNQDKETDFIPVVAWEKLAEICGQYLDKGSLVSIDGALRTRTYEKDGQKRKTFEILCSELVMLGGGSSHGGGEKNSKPAAAKTGGADWSDCGGNSYGQEVGLGDIPF